MNTVRSPVYLRLVLSRSRVRENERISLRGREGGVSALPSLSRRLSLFLFLSLVFGLPSLRWIRSKASVRYEAPGLADHGYFLFSTCARDSIAWLIADSNRWNVNPAIDPPPRNRLTGHTTRRDVVRRTTRTHGVLLLRNPNNLTLASKPRCVESLPFAEFLD